MYIVFIFSSGATAQSDVVVWSGVAMQRSPFEVLFGPFGLVVGVTFGLLKFPWDKDEVKHSSIVPVYSSQAATKFHTSRMSSTLGTTYHTAC